MCMKNKQNYNLTKINYNELSKNKNAKILEIYKNIFKICVILLLTINLITLFNVVLNINKCLSDTYLKTNSFNLKTNNTLISDIENLNNYKYEFFFQGKQFKFKQEDFKNIKLSEYQKKLINNNVDKVELIERLKNLGLSKEEIVRYVLPESELIYDKLNLSVGKQAKPEQIEILKNTCTISFVEGIKGRFINRIDFFEKFYNQASKGDKNIRFELLVDDYELSSNTKTDFVEKGCFSTNFSSSSSTRKNNIKVALSSFDGIVLDEGEVLSFNQTTGIRNDSSGYLPAKIITGGTYVLGYGGGVCQVSTTLYNACLLAGLEILEVNNHSLPVSYVEPSFDAMVNVGSSDLIIRNNTNGKIIITTSSKNDICKVKIYGKKNLYKITRFSEKTKILKAGGDKIDNDYQKYGLEDMQVGEERRISFAKDGFCSKGYLNYYDEKGNLVETKKIRENKYNPSIGVIVKREN